MGGKMSKNKGKDGERKVRDLFRDALDGYIPDTSVIRRNHQQAEIGGADLVGVPIFSVEVKRVKKIVWGKSLMDWWEQCVEQALEERKYPCLVFRQDFGSWLVMIQAYPAGPAQHVRTYPMLMMWDAFEFYYRNALKECGRDVDIY